MSTPPGQFPIVDEKNDMQTPPLSQSRCRAKLNPAIEAMLSPRGNSEFPSILRTIQRHLRQYQLRDRLTAHEVFNEACKRALEKCEKGEEIPNIPAWFRTTCFHIISEKSREFKRTDSKLAAESDLESTIETQLDQTLLRSPQPNRLEILARLELYERLPALERKILHLQAIGFSWEEIAQRLLKSGEQQGELQQVAQAIAKRASRARQQLRNQYWQ